MLPRPQGALALALLLTVPSPFLALPWDGEREGLRPGPPAGADEAGLLVDAEGTLLALPPLPFPLALSGEGRDARSLLLLPPEAAARVDARLLDPLRLAREGFFVGGASLPVVVRTKGLLEDLAPLRGLLDGVRGYDRFPLVAGRVALADLPALALHDTVRRVHLDDVTTLHLTQSVRVIRADEVHQRTTLLGERVTGEGVRIAVLDTGVDYTHPDLGGCLGPECKVVGGWDFVHGDADPFDDHGHGTHVASIAAGLRGVAPEASLLAYKVCDAFGGCWVSTILEALDRALDDGADVISISLGGPGSPDSPLSVAVDEAVEEGAVVAVSAGNSGDWDPPGQPASAARAITVGASYKSDYMTWFSTRGPAYDANQALVAMKPDVVAPGADIVAAVPRGDCALCHPSGLRALSGTSMSAPMVSGTAALLLQGHPSWTPEDVKAAVMGTAQPLHDSAYLDARFAGRGRLDALEAYDAQLALSPANLFLGVDVTSEPLFAASAQVKIKNLGRLPLVVNLSGEGRGYDVHVEEVLPAPGDPGLPGPATLLPGQATLFNVTVRADNDRLQDGWHDAVLRAHGVAALPGLGPLPPLPAPPGAPAPPEVGALLKPAQANGTATFVKSGIVHFDAAGWFWAYDLLRPDGWPEVVTAPSTRFYHLAAPGPLTVVGLGPAPGATIGFVLRDRIDHRGNTTLRLDPAEADRRAKMDLPREGGPPLAPGTPFCRRTASPDPCIVLGSALLSRPDRRFGQFVLSDDPVSAAVSFSEEGWTLGLAADYRAGGTTYRARNAVAPAALPADLTVPLEDFREHRLRYQLPYGDLTGTRTDFCSYGGLGIGTSRPIVAGEEERFLGGRADLPEATTPEGGRLDRAACERMHAHVARDLPYPPGYVIVCGLGGVCPIFSSSPTRRLLEDQVLFEDFRLLQAPRRGDPRFMLRDGAVPVVDGASAYVGDLFGHPDRLEYWPTGPGSYFAPGSGHLNWWQWQGDKVTFEVRRNGEVLEAGPLTGVQYQRATQWSPHGGLIEYRAVFEQALPITGVNATAEAYLRYDANATEGLHPQVLWARVVDDHGLGTRFPSGAPLRLAVKVTDNGGAAVTRVDLAVRLEGGATAEWPAAAPVEAGLYVVDVPDLGPGAYHVEVRAEAADGDVVALRQAPAFLVEG